MAFSKAEQKVLDIARAEIGTHESPAGSNRQKYGAFFHDNGVAWCAIFVCWVLNMAGFLALIFGFNDFTAGMAETFNKHGQFSKTPKGLCIVFFNFGKPDGWNGRFRGIHHVGIRFGQLADGRQATIEGNTSLTSNANGGEVQTRYRDPSGIAGYGIIKWPVDPPTVMYTVPKVTGMSAAYAVKYLANWGLYSDVKDGKVGASDVPKYIISSQSPAAGSKVPKGSTVLIVQSMGK